MVAHRLCVQSRPARAGGRRGRVEPPGHDRRHHLRPARRSRRYTDLVVGAQPLRLIHSPTLRSSDPSARSETSTTWSARDATVAPVSTTPCTLARSKLAPVRSAPERSALRRSVSLKLVLWHVASTSTAPCRRVSRNCAPASVALRSEAPVRSAL